MKQSLTADSDCLENSDFDFSFKGYAGTDYFLTVSVKFVFCPFFKSFGNAVVYTVSNDFVRNLIFNTITELWISELFVQFNMIIENEEGVNVQLFQMFRVLVHCNAVLISSVIISEEWDKGYLFAFQTPIRH